MKSIVIPPRIRFCVYACLCSVLLTALVFAFDKVRSVIAAGDLVPMQTDRYIYVTGSDILIDAVPMSLEIAREKEFYTISEIWCGKPLPNSERPSALIRITINCIPSVDDAKRMANSSLDSVAIPPDEVTGKAPYNTFSDLAWSSPNRLLFIRKNVLCDIYTSIKDEAARKKQLLSIAVNIGKRIDALADDKPIPAESLPVFANELHIGLYQAWSDRDLGESLWGEKKSSLAIIVNQGIQRKIPAKRISAAEYLVPLSYIAALLDTEARVNIENHGASIKINNHTVKMKAGQKEITSDGKIISITQPIV